MKKEKIEESEGNTFYLRHRGIPKGCELCLKGQKAVLFLNGICQKPHHCWWYCPISEKRRGKDITFADEIRVETIQDLFQEIDTIKALGMSITGGEPILDANLEKTLDYIKRAKEKYGKEFHIHLYTNGINMNEEIAVKLAQAGLDEIRFHPSREYWSNIKFALNKGMTVGAELPMIPNHEYLEELKEFILYLDKIGAEFINLNEFEFCFPNSQNLKERGFILEKGTIASALGSRKEGIKLLHGMESKVKLKLHFCTIRAKDHFQLKARYKRRAETIKKPYELVTEEGLLLFAQIEGQISKLKELKRLLTEEVHVPSKFLTFDGNTLKLPPDLALDDHFATFLDDLFLKGYIVEIIPFRGEYSQITEKTPLDIFKEEIESR